MNKKLVALAVGSAFAMPLAVQAQTANVTLYGRLNMDLEFVSGRTCANGVTGGTGGTGTNTGGGQSSGGFACASGSGVILPANQISNTTTNRISSNSSRFGMRGTESLGGGLNAVFQVESNVQGDTGNASNSGLASRDTFVGLQGGWGRAVFGNVQLPLDDLHPIFGNAPTLTTSILSTSALWALGPLNANTGGFDQRQPNTFRYDSPNMMGFTASLGYSTMDSSGASNTNGVSSAGSQAQNINHANIVGANLIYSNGPFQAAAAFQVNNKVRNAYAAGGPNLRDTDWTATVSYNFGTIMQGFGLQVALVYEQTRYNVQSAAVAGSSCNVTTSGTCSLNRNFGGGSATIPLGGGKIYAFYGKASNGRGSAPDGTAVGMTTRGGSTGAQQWEVSYSYNLSPRTMLYAGITRIQNQCKGSYNFSSNAYPIAVGQVNAAAGSAGDFCSGSPGGGIFGIVHFF